MNNIYVFGECMIELRDYLSVNSSKDDVSPNILKQSFAGDVLNTAVYLKRTFPDIKAHFISAVGKDKFSSDMLSFFDEEGVNRDLVFQSDNKIPGIYAIETDDTGERTFSYWRENSAAKEVMSFINETTINQMLKNDLFFFSGISLAVINIGDRPMFWKMIDRLKKIGVRIVFDPNYRPRMWNSQEQTKEQFEKAFTMADIALPGVDDLQKLYGIETSEGVNEFCQSFNIAELIIKNGEKGVLSYHEEQLNQFKVIPETNVVDTTSAGDSFNGVYLGARMNGYDIYKSIEFASQAAGFVIQHQGAIVNKAAYQRFIQQQTN
jgi:2-dehydro-3-deoxygluconokinase